MLPIFIAAQIVDDDDRLYLESLYNENFKVLAVYANSILQNWEDAFDLVQSLFLEMTGHIDTLRSRDRPYGYLKTCLSRNIYDYLNKRSVKAFSSMDEFQEQYGELPDVSVSVEGAVVRSEVYRLLRTYVRELKPLYRSFIILHYYFELKTKDISELLDITPEYASVIHKRAKEELKRRIPRRAMT